MTKITTAHKPFESDVQQHAVPIEPITHQLDSMLAQETHLPLFIQGTAETILHSVPDGIIDFCMTSPPYWGKREYANGGIGLEDTFNEYIANLLTIFSENGAIVSASGVSGVRYKR
ncbi:MAG: hypothetical protein WAU00_04350, partial [Caldilinea sp.]